MIDQDEYALNLRCLVGLGLMLDATTDDPSGTLQLVGENVPPRDIDESRVWCRWTIEAGDSRRTQSDGARLQLGVATLQIIAPSGTYTNEARALRDQFFALFRDWRSPDNCLEVYQQSVTTPPSKDDYRINARVYWRSVRS